MEAPVSPDKVHTVTLAATTIYTTGNVVGYEAAVTHALNLYDEASRQVRASGPTSTEPKDCSCGATAFGYKDGPTHDANCPRFFRA